MVYQSILTKLKRFLIPFTAVSTSSLLVTFKTAYADTVAGATGRTMLERGDVSKGYFSGKAIAERGGGFEEFRGLFQKLDQLTEMQVKALDWLNNLPVSLPKLTADLLTNIYHLLSNIALKTPLFIFNNPYIKNTSLTFAIVSITVVTLLTIYEAIMQMLNKQHTDFKTILKRYALVASLSGFLPFAFESGFTFLNQLSDAISNIGAINGGDANGFVSGKVMGFFDTLIIVLFNITAISLLIPVCLQAGRRWWDLMCLATIAPLALSTFVFNRHKHYFTKWWSSVKELSLVQIVYSVLILLFGIFIFMTQSMTGGFYTMAIKLLIAIGALYRLSHPPQFVTKMADDSNVDVVDMYNKHKDTAKSVWNTITLKNLQPLNFIKDQMKQKKSASTLALRRKHGRRFVK